MLATHITVIAALVGATAPAAPKANPGNSSFAFSCFVPATYPVGSFPAGITAADFDGINGPDVATANQGTHDVSVLLNNGDGTFQAAIPYAASDNPYDVASADFDGVNGPDLAVASLTNSHVSVLLNNGNGTFASAVPYPAQNGSLSIVIADLDGKDGLDIIAGGSRGISILLNDGTGAFPNSTAYGVTDGAWVAVGDLVPGNGPDVVTSSPTGDCCSYTKLYENRGDATFEPPVDLEEWNVMQGAITTADFNGVSGDDFVVTMGNGFFAYYNDGSGQFGGPLPNWNDWSGLAWDAVAADLDCADGIDLVTPSRGGTVEVFLNYGTGAFRGPIIFGAGRGSLKMAVADFDMNGAPDWAIADASDNTVSVALNCVAGSCLQVDWLLRNGDSLSAQPLAPPKSELFSRMSQGLFIEHGYIEGITSGDLDPDTTILTASKPFVLYQVPGCDELKLVKDQGSIRLHY